MRNPLRIAYFSLPGASWFLFFLVLPLLLVCITSFLTRGTYGGIVWTASSQNFLRVMDPVYFKILTYSLELALFTTSLCFAIGFPVALAMASASPRVRTFLAFALAIPFLTNLIIRVYALKMIFGFDGPILSLLSYFGIANNPFAFSHNAGLVFYGMVSTYLPFMVFPLYSALEKFDYGLIEAAQDLGAGQRTILWRVILPNVRTAIRSGCMLVFIPAMGEFVIPDLLGGAKTMLVGNLITEQFLKSRDWPFGSALSITLMAIVGLSIVGSKFISRGTRRARA